MPRYAEHSPLYAANWPASPPTTAPPPATPAPPSRSLGEYPASSAYEKAKQVFGKTAQRYDILNTLMSLGLDRYWRHAVIDACELTGSEKILDLGAGTGSLTFAAARAAPRAQLIGLDPVPEMLAIAEKNALEKKLQDRVSFQEGVGESLLYPAETFDQVITAFTLRNFSDRQKVFSECRRVLKQNGRFVSVELTRPKNPLLRILHRVFVRSSIPLLGFLLSDTDAYRYLAETVLNFPEPESIAEEMRSSGFGSVQIRPLTFGITTLHIARR